MPEAAVYNYISYSIKQTTVHLFLNFSKWIIQARFLKSDNSKIANKVLWKMERYEPEDFLRSSTIVFFCFIEIGTTNCINSDLTENR